jgi:hypothetical protein
MVGLRSWASSFSWCGRGEVSVVMETGIKGIHRSATHPKRTESAHNSATLPRTDGYSSQCDRPVSHIDPSNMWIHKVDKNRCISVKWLDVGFDSRYEFRIWIGSKTFIKWPPRGFYSVIKRLKHESPFNPFSFIVNHVPEIYPLSHREKNISFNLCS